jgi:hypothetical protein
LYVGKSAQRQETVNIDKMSAVEYCPSSFPAFNLTNSTTTTAAAAAAAADRMKSDFQTALRRNLHNWALWRIQLNDNLASAVITGCQMAEVEPIGACLDRAAPHPGHPTNNPKTLLTYSAAANSSTPLPNDEFFKYGIPRARVDPQLQHLQQRRLEALDSRSLSHSAPNLGNGRRHLVGRWLFVFCLITVPVLCVVRLVSRKPNRNDCCHLINSYRILVISTDNEKKVTEDWLMSAQAAFFFGLKAFKACSAVSVKPSFRD